MKTRQKNRSLRFLCGLLLLTVFNCAWAAPFLATSSDKIQRQLEAIEQSLTTLPQTNPSRAPSSHGFRTRFFESATMETSVEIAFAQPAAVDLITLMPAALIQKDNDLSPFGFPKRFYIERKLTDGTYEIIADHRSADYLLHGIEPQLFPCDSIKPTTGIRITSTLASNTRPLEKSAYIFAFSEVYAFEGAKNVALNAQTISANGKWQPPIWHSGALTDSVCMYAPVQPRYVSHKKVYRAYTDEVILFFDLGQSRQVDELRIWPVAAATEFILPITSGIHFPTDIKLELLEHPNAPPSRTLYRSSNKTRPGSNPLIVRLPSVNGRYFKLTLKEGFPLSDSNQNEAIAVAEVELLGGGINYTQGIIPTEQIRNPRKPVYAQPVTLTDGLASDGSILPLREWVETFARAQVLKRERAHLQKQLKKKLQREKEQIRIVAVTAIALVIILCLMIWVVRLLAARRAADMREQISCDLHDEIGANLSSIAHSAELIQESIDAPTPMQTCLLDNAVLIARDTANETRDFVHLLNPKKNSLPLTTQMQECAAQILGTLPYEFQLEETLGLNKMSPLYQWNTFLFFKEAMNNIIKHAQATHVTIQSRQQTGRISLTISDNGIGLKNPTLLPLNLKYRADKLSAHLNITSEPNQGTTITLTLPKRMQS